MILDILTVLFFVLGFVLILWMIGERRRDVLYGPYVPTRVPVHKPGRRALSVTAKFGNGAQSGSAASAVASAAFRTLRLSGPCNRAVRRAAETLHATFHMPKMLYSSGRLVEKTVARMSVRFSALQKMPARPIRQTGKAATC